MIFQTRFSKIALSRFTLDKSDAELTIIGRNWKSRTHRFLTRMIWNYLIVLILIQFTVFLAVVQCLWCPLHVNLLICIWPFLSLHNSRCHGQCRLSNCPIIHWDISAVCEAPMCWLCGSSTIWGLSCISICVCPVTARTSRSSSPQSKHLTQLWSLRLHPRTQTPPAHWAGTWGLGGSFEHRME